MGEPAHNSDKFKKHAAKRLRYTHIKCASMMPFMQIWIPKFTQENIQGKMMDHQNLLYGNPKDIIKKKLKKIVTSS